VTGTMVDADHGTLPEPDGATAEARAAKFKSCPRIGRQIGDADRDHGRYGAGHATGARNRPLRDEYN
jgi:hypothetical protein